MTRRLNFWVAYMMLNKRFMQLTLPVRRFRVFHLISFMRALHQSLEAWEAELKQAIAYVVDHLSLYQLTIEEGTLFFALHQAKKFEIPDQDHAAALYQLTQDVTARHGLPNYEISNHAQLGAESQHNLIYWRYGDYVGAGPGAHGRLPDGEKRRVTMTERHPETWLEMVEREGHGITA